MSLFPVVQRPLDKAGTSYIEARREDGHGSGALVPSFVAGSNAFSTLNSSTTPLAGGATFTGTYEDISNYVSVSVIVNTDSLAASDSLHFDFSTDGTNLDYSVPVDVVVGGDWASLPAKAKFVRIRLIAGAGAQTYLRLQTHYSAIAESPKMTPLIDEITDRSAATLTRSVIEGHTTAGGGGYVPVKVNPSGALTVAATITNESGTWGYRSGITGTPSIPAGARVLSISAIAPADTPASFTVDGGSAITIPGYQNFSLSPKGNLIAPVLVFTGTESYVVEFVT